MNVSPVSVSTEQLLMPFGRLMLNLNVRMHQPQQSHGTVFCFHGYTGNGLDFATLAAFLAANGYTVVAADIMGRGASGYFAEPRRYNLKNTVAAAAAIFEKYRGKANHVIGMGWGGVVAMLLLSAARAKIGKFIIADVPLDYSTDADKTVAQAFADVGRRFESREAAARHVLSTAEFAARTAEIEAVTHRVRGLEGAYALNHDDGIVDRLAEFSGKQFDLRALLGAIRGECLMLFGPLLDPGARAATEAASTRTAPLACIDGLTPAGPLLFRTQRELLMVLGCLSAEPGSLLRTC